MQELAQSTDIQKRSLLVQQRLINATIDNINASRLADVYASFARATPQQLQAVLEEVDAGERLLKVLVLLRREQEEVKLQMSIMSKIQEKMGQQQHKHLLKEQKKMIDHMLGQGKGDKQSLLQKYEQRLKGKVVPAAVKAVIDEELTKLQSIEGESQDFNLVKNYLDWLTVVPWGVYTPEQYSITHAERILQADHYGLDDVKQRILELIATSSLLGHVPNTKTLCLVGAPGVGKTSIGHSIARALNRKFYRFSVGGLDDVSEIKGHRRTYVGSMPGKLIQQLKSAECSNPVIMLDEVDKLGRGGWRGDPAAALLEVLDPEQNGSFMDLFLDVPVDLSKVLFICTANTTDTIPAALADRMDFINLSGYIAAEKVQIASKYLQPLARKRSGVSESELLMNEDTLLHLIRWYAREAGVRKLSKLIEKIYSKVALQLTRQPPILPPVTVTPDNLSDYVGKRQYSSDRMYERTPVGVAMGLAWTSHGGSCIFIESTVSNREASRKGRGGSRRRERESGGVVESIDSGGVDETDKESSNRGLPIASGPLQLFTTGQLGDVMRESSTIAYTVAKRLLASLEPGNPFFHSHQLHLHVPSGSTPKDGPSAGITMTSALLSLALNAELNQAVAMTGELTVTGRVTAIGGVKEKVLAARQASVTELILPADNRKDWDELDDELREGIQAHFVERMEQVLDVVLRDWKAAKGKGSMLGLPVGAAEDVDASKNVQL